MKLKRSRPCKASRRPDRRAFVLLCVRWEATGRLKAREYGDLFFKAIALVLACESKNEIRETHSLLHWTW